MADGFASMLGLVTGSTKMDAPVPACLNHCINQEVFNCKICGEMFDNIHKYITHGKSHRGSSTVCGWCGGVWPNYSALCIHQLVWEEKESEESNSVGSDRVEGSKVTCPLCCGIEPLSLTMMRSHLATFHGAAQNNLIASEEDGSLDVSVDEKEPTTTCPKCETTLFSEKVNLDYHLGFQCLKRSAPVVQRVQEIQEQSVMAGEEPILLLLQEIQALILHLKGLLEHSGYRERFLEVADSCDKVYSQLPKGFTQDYLGWVPVGYTLQVLESEKNNFPVMLEVWSQVVEKLAGPPQLQDVCLKLEAELGRKVGGELAWGSLTFDPAMLQAPQQTVLNKLERELGWVK